MLELIIGMVITALFGVLIVFCQTRKLSISWFQWILLIMEALFIIFWLEIIAAFLMEGSFKGALVNGILIGFMVAVIGVLLYRFIFKSKLKGKVKEKI